MWSQAILVSALAALAAAQSAVISFTNPLPAPAVVGQVLELTWATTDASSPVTILLRKGDPDDLKTVSTLLSSGSGGKYPWTPSTDLAPGADYALQIQQGSEINYLGPFAIEGGSASTPSSSSSSSSSSSASSSSTSSAALPPVYGGSSSSVSITASPSLPAVPPYGTGNATIIPSNTTLSSATLTRTATPTGSGAGFQGSQTRPGAAQSTGGASTLLAGSSAIALALGAVVALVMA